MRVLWSVDVCRMSFCGEVALPSPLMLSKAFLAAFAARSRLEPAVKPREGTALERRTAVEGVFQGGDFIHWARTFREAWWKEKMGRKKGKHGGKHGTRVDDCSHGMSWKLSGNQWFVT